MKRENETAVAIYDLEQLNKMTSTTNHPVMKKIIRQLFVESIPVILLLAIYYDIFDGQEKGWIWHLVLVLSALMLLLHNMLGIYLISNVNMADNIKDSLAQYYKKIKRFAYMAISTRLLALIGLVLFLINGEISKLVNWYSLAALLVLVVQFYFLQKIWQNRLRIIQTSIESFSS